MRRARPRLQRLFIPAATLVAATLLALVLMAGQYARAAEAKVITLSCNGSFPDLDFNNTTATPNKPKAGGEEMGVVVNLD
jgi:hypothetical protein